MLGVEFPLPALLIGLGFRRRQRLRFPRSFDNFPSEPLGKKRVVTVVTRGSQRSFIPSAETCMKLWNQQIHV